MFPHVGQTEHHGDEKRVKLVLHYDGRNFYGWQAQRNRRTVQGEFSTLLARICGRESTVTGAGRTDRGVHATGQVVSALVPERLSDAELRRALNALAPSDLWVVSAERVPRSFHPRYDAVSRTYSYRVGVNEEADSPFMAPWCWPLGRPLELDRMRAEAEVLSGPHNFGGFAKSGQPERGAMCHVFAAEWRESPIRNGILEFEISADRFLHRMVRYLVGTMIEVGLRRRPVGTVARILDSDPGARSARPAPANGLWLTRVEYRPNDGEKRDG